MKKQEKPQFVRDIGLGNFLQEVKPALEHLVLGQKAEVVKARDDVYSRYQPIFDLKNLPKLKAEDFYSFLLFENNHHWTGLNRSGHKIISDMPKLKKSLQILLDESKPIEHRMNQSLQLINGMGKAIATAVLHVANPKKYGVWNNTSESGLNEYSLFPTFERGMTIGEKYKKVNDVLLAISDATELDLWSVDAVWWSPSEVSRLTTDAAEVLPTEELASHLFGLERHLHEFLRDNWEKTTLGKEWDLYSEIGEDEITGYEYRTPIGRIDLLARHKKNSDWLIVELKRDQSPDATVGQVLRYIGWVKENMAQPKEEVFGLIISHQADEKIQYALSVISNVSIQLYEVDFRLKEATKIARTNNQNSITRANEKKKKSG